MNTMTIYSGQTNKYIGDYRCKVDEIKLSCSQLVTNEVVVPISVKDISEGDYVILYLQSGHYLGVVQFIDYDINKVILNVSIGINSYKSEIKLGRGSIPLTNFSFNNYGGKINIKTDNTSVQTTDSGLDGATLFRQIIRTKNFEESHDIDNFEVRVKDRSNKTPMELRLDEPGIVNYEVSTGNDSFNAVQLVSKTTGLNKIWCIDRTNTVVPYTTSVRLLPELRRIIDVEEDTDVSLSTAQRELRDQTYSNTLMFDMRYKFLEFPLLSYLGKKVKINYPIDLDTQINEVTLRDGIVRFRCGILNTKLTDKWRDK